MADLTVGAGHVSRWGDRTSVRCPPAATSRSVRWPPRGCSG